VKQVKTPGVASVLGAMVAVQAVVMIGVVTLPVMAPVAAPAFGLPASAAGYFQSCAFVGAAVAALMSGTLATRYGGIRVSQWCCLLTIVGLALPVFVWLPALVLGALLVGAGYGMATPAASLVLAKVTPPGMRGVIFSVKQSAVPLGGAVAGLTVPALAEAADWRIAIGASVAIVIAASLTLLPLRKALDTHLDTTAQVTMSSMLGNVTMVWRHAGLRALACVAFTYAAVQVGLFALYVTILVEAAARDLIQAGYCYAVMQGVGVGARIFWGWVTDKFVSANMVLAGLGVVAIAGCALLTQIDASWSMPELLALSAVLGSSIIGWNGVYLAQIPRLVDLPQVSTATAGTVLFSFAGVVLGPAFMALSQTVTGAYWSAFWALNAMVLLTIVYLLYQRRPDKIT
jgi:MFS family permease